MVNNMHLYDRILRAALAVIIIILFLTGQLSGLAAIILGLIAVIFLLTSASGFCPTYKLLGISTKKEPPANK